MHTKFACNPTSDGLDGLLLKLSLRNLKESFSETSYILLLKSGGVKLEKTPLNDVHKKLGAKMVEFGGWEMPVQYSSIITEHLAVREKCGLFDVSHMGEIIVRGSEALVNLQKLVTNDVSRLVDGRVLYTPMCYNNGGIVDDLLIYRLKENEYLLVVNASNIEKDYNWIVENLSGDVEISNVSSNYAQLAIQGPESLNILQEVLEIDLSTLKYYWFIKTKIAGEEAIVSRTGYTGELGFEVYLNPNQSVLFWNKLMETGKEYGMLPIGLGARDTLRLEKKFCLYGNDIDQNRHPLEAGLAWTVKLLKGDFIGRDALLNYQNEGYQDRLIGFKLVGRGIARHGYEIKNEGKKIGVVTSGSYSPSLDENIGLGYVKKEISKIGQKMEITIRNRTVSAVIVETPFVN